MVAKIAKQKAGFKFGLHRLTVLETIGEIKHKDRTYRVLRVRTEDGLIYRSIRLYNPKGKFIKQLLYEPQIRKELGKLVAKGT